MAKAKEHARIDQNSQINKSEMMRKSAVKFDQMPGKYEKKRAFFAQRDASDFVQ